MEEAKKLNEVLSSVKALFVGKDEIVDLLGIGLIARENVFLFGPPGTAKSAIVRQLSRCITEGKNFEYLLTRFTEPNEIFGPFDIRKLKEGELVTNVQGMMPEASLVFLDEIFNANSAILNSLLMALNEKIFRRGKETIQLPALMFVGASNSIPEDETLYALLDRFLIRVRCDYVDTDQLEQVLLAGWKLDSGLEGTLPSIHPNEIKVLQKENRKVDLSAIRAVFMGLVHELRTTGIRVSDRRAVKLQNLIAASALICGRTAAELSDLWVMKYIWDTDEQVEILASMIDNVIKNDVSDKSHPQAHFNRIPNAEELMKEVELLTSKWKTENLPFEEKSILKDKLRYVQSRSNWISNAEHKRFIQSSIEELWQQILESK